MLYQAFPYFLTTKLIYIWLTTCTATVSHAYMLHIDIMDENDRESSPEIPFQGTTPQLISWMRMIERVALKYLPLGPLQRYACIGSTIDSYVTINCRGKGERLVRRERKFLR